MKLLADRLLLRKIKSERVTESGIILQGQSDFFVKGEVVYVGLSVPDVSPGDTILYSPSAGCDVEWEGDLHRSIFYPDVVAIIDKDLVTV